VKAQSEAGHEKPNHTRQGPGESVSRPSRGGRRRSLADRHETHPLLLQITMKYTIVIPEGLSWRIAKMFLLERAVLEFKSRVGPALKSIGIAK
jgi:hypothetical protein